MEILKNFIILKLIGFYFMLNLILCSESSFNSTITDKNNIQIKRDNSNTRIMNFIDTPGEKSVIIIRYSQESYHVCLFNNFLEEISFVIAHTCLNLKTYIEKLNNFLKEISSKKNNPDKLGEVFINQVNLLIDTLMEARVQFNNSYFTIATRETRPLPNQIANLNRKINQKILSTIKELIEMPKEVNCILEDYDSSPSLNAYFDDAIKYLCETADWFKRIYWLTNRNYIYKRSDIFYLDSKFLNEFSTRKNSISDINFERLLSNLSSEEQTLINQKIEEILDFLRPIIFDKRTKKVMITEEQEKLIIKGIDCREKIYILIKNL